MGECNLDSNTSSLGKICLLWGAKDDCHTIPAHYMSEWHTLSPLKPLTLRYQEGWLSHDSSPHTGQNGRYFHPQNHCIVGHMEGKLTAANSMSVPCPVKTGPEYLQIMWQLAVPHINIPQWEIKWGNWLQS